MAKPIKTLVQKNVKPRKPESLFRKTFNSIFTKPKMFLYVILLDLAFFVIFFLLNLLANYLMPKDPTFISRVQSDTMLMIFFVLVIIAYFVIMLLIYSFFSLVILGNIKSLSVKHDFDFSLFKNMFFLNLLLFVFFFLLVVILNLALGFLINKSIWIGIIVGIVLLIILFMAYAFYNFTHSSFILGHELKYVIKKSLKHVFSNVYLETFLFSFGVIAVYIILYFLAGLFFKDFIMNNYNAFVNISSIIILVIVYILFAINRVYFFFIAEKHIGHKK